MLQDIEYLGGSQLGGGVVTFPNFFNLQPNQSPNAINVKFGIGGTVEKRLGTNTLNATALVSTAGWGTFDFGATNIRWLVVAAGSSILASSNRGLTFVTVASGNQTQNYQYFERNRSLLIATSEARDPVLFWAGSVNTFMQVLAVNSAPATKYAIAYQGFLFLMNSAERPRGMYYSADNVATTDPWDSSFDLPSTFDDEITGATILNRKMYVFMRYKTFRVSFVGGNPDFSYQDIKDWGMVQGTVKKITLPEVGEVIIGLDWNRNLRIFDGSEDQITSDSFKEDNGMSTVFMERININAINTSRAENDTNELVYKLLVPIGTATRPSHAICFNYRIGALYPYDSYGYMQFVMAQSSNDQRLLGVTSDGRIHVMDSGNRDNGVTAVTEFYDSPFFFNKNPQAVSKTQRVTLSFAVTSSDSLYYQDRTDFANAFNPTRERINFANTAGILQVQQTIDIPLTQNVYQFRVSSSSGTATPYKLNRVDLGMSSLGYGDA